MAVSITRFSIDGLNLGRLRLLQMQHADALDGTDQIIVTCYNDLQKHDRLVWQDKQGFWHEHIVDEPKRSHDDAGRPTTTATCINSLAETWDDYIVDVRPSGGVQLALERILTGTRWTAGTCTQAASASHTFYHISVREALQELVNVWGGELVTTIVVDGSKVTQRIVRIVSARGNLDSPKRFTWTKDILTIDRTVGSQNPKTRIYAYGRGEETDTGGFGRRIGIESVNGGLPYVEDAQATAIWGRPDGMGGKLPAIGKYENDQCEDPAQLLVEARKYLEQAKAPQVTYVADVIDLADYGRAWEEVSVGDHVAIVDAEFCDEGIYLQGRISKIERDLLEGTTVVTFGTLTDAIASPWRTLQARLAALTSRATYWDVVSAADSSWLEVLITQLNAAYNTAGTYHYSSFEKGEIWSNVPLDEDGNAISTSEESWAMNINGRGFRLASGFNADGTWNWRTFGDGKGFVATEMIAGVIRDAMGNNWWNLETGDFRLAGTSTLGNRTVQQALSGIDATITRVDVEYAQGTSETVAPTTGWSTAAPAYESGKYIWSRTATTNANGITYSAPVMISGKDGTSGVGISSTTISYGTSASDATDPTNWQPSAPTLTKGQWLWVRTVYAYTDSSTKTTYTKSYVGTDGEDGTSVFVQSATKSGDTTTVVIADSDGNTSTLTIKDGEDGTNGTAGANGYVHTAWATSADGSQGFSTSVSAGKTYLGVYTDNTAADSQRYQDYSWSLIKGADGTSVTVDSIEYGTSASATTEPTTWSTTAPTTIAKGLWLWAKTTYSDNSTATTKSYVGTDGEDGTSVFVQSATKSGDTTTVVIADSDGNTSTLTIKDGEDGTNGTAGANGYVHTAWATSADGSQGFSTSVSAGKTYLGVYTDNTAADSQRYQDYSWSLIKGADGEDGIGITSIVEQYYLSTSSTTQTGGTWSTTQPTWESGKYIWTRSEITWDTTPATTTTTTPILATALTQANSQAKAANDAVDAISTQQAIFNLLTNNGALQGLYMSGGQLYVNASYILSGILALGGANNTNGRLIVYDESGNVVATLDKDGLAATGDLVIQKTVPSSRRGRAEITDGTFYPRTTRAGMQNIGLIISSKCLTSGAYYNHNNTVQIFPNYRGTLNNSVIFADSALELQSQQHNYSPYTINGGMDPEHNATKLVIGNGGLNLYYEVLGSSSTSNNTFGVSQGGSVSCKGMTITGNLKVQQTSTDIALWGDVDINGAVDISKNTVVHGNLTVSGTKPRIIETEDYGTLTNYAYETPSPMFGDVGSAAIDSDGYCIVSIDDLFSETARVDFVYQVFLQKCGAGDVWVDEKHRTYFVVRGTPDLRFDWEIKARQTGFENLRIDSFETDSAQWDGLKLSERAAIATGGLFDGEQQVMPSYTDPVSELEELYMNELQAS